MPRKTLIHLIHSDQSLTADRGRCEALLKDHVPEGGRGLKVLLTSLREGIPRQLAGSGPHAPIEERVARLAARFADENGLDPGMAHWAVETWAMALGLLPSDDAAPSASSPSSRQTARPLNSAGTSPNALDTARVDPGFLRSTESLAGRLSAPPFRGAVMRALADTKDPRELLHVANAAREHRVKAFLEQIQIPKATFDAETKDRLANIHRHRRGGEAFTQTQERLKVERQIEWERGTLEGSAFARTLAMKSGDAVGAVAHLQRHAALQRIAHALRELEPIQDRDLARSSSGRPR